VEKVFQKIQDGGWNEKIRLSRHSRFFEKKKFTKFAYYKRRLKNLMR
jgi:hypothetical protein